VFNSDSYLAAEGEKKQTRRKEEEKNSDYTTLRPLMKKSGSCIVIKREGGREG